MVQGLQEILQVLEYLVHPNNNTPLRHQVTMAMGKLPMLRRSLVNQPHLQIPNKPDHMILPIYGNIHTGLPGGPRRPLSPAGPGVPYIWTYYGYP